MALLLKNALELAHVVLVELKDPKTAGYGLLHTPIPTAFIVVVYLVFVKEIGPKLMAERKPFNIDRIVQIYDLVQVALCASILYKAWQVILNINYVCEPMKFDDSPRSHLEFDLVYNYFVLKIIDLCDTVFFVLRKKNSQISFLHVYHHAIMTVGVWAAATYFAGGHIIVLGIFNSVVHMIMYLYYFLTSIKVMSRDSWVKKYMTIIQILQFALILISFSSALYVGCYCRPIIFFVMLQSMVMMTLFGHFYYKNYIVQPKKIQ